MENLYCLCDMAQSFSQSVAQPLPHSTRKPETAVVRVKCERVDWSRASERCSIRTNQFYAVHRRSARLPTRNMMKQRAHSQRRMLLRSENLCDNNVCGFKNTHVHTPPLSHYLVLVSSNRMWWTAHAPVPNANVNYCNMLFENLYLVVRTARTNM